jgi:hypothetical protein
MVKKAPEKLFRIPVVRSSSYGMIWWVLLFSVVFFGCESDGSSSDPDLADSDVSIIELDVGQSFDTQFRDVGSVILDADTVADGALDDAALTDGSLGDAALNDAALADAEVAPPSCVPPVSQLQFSVWPTVFENRCTLCHYEDGTAISAGAQFVLRDPSNPGRFEDAQDVHQSNLDMIMSFRNAANGEPYLLPKASGSLGHGGGQQLVPNGPEYQSLSQLFVQYDLFQMDVCEDTLEDSITYQEVMARLELQTPVQTFRSFVIQTLGRLPTDIEISQIEQGMVNTPILMTGNMRMPDADDNDGRDVGEVSVKAQMTVVRTLIDSISARAEFKPWLKEQWNDVFMFRGVLSQDLDRAYEVFSPHDFGARSWSDMCGIKVPLTDEGGEFIDGPGEQPLCNLLHQRFNYPEITSPPRTPAQACEDCAFSRRGIAYWMLYGAIEEPLELIASIIQQRRPFTEIVTSEDIMMNYYTSMAYFGTADPEVNQFVADMDNHPMHPQLKNGPSHVVYDVAMPDHRIFKSYQTIRRTHFGSPPPPAFTMSTVQPRVMTYKDQSDFPRAGILSSAAFMKRFPGSDLNMQRHRAWQTMRLLLDYDILLNQGDRLSIADVDDPNGGATVTNLDCASCHSILDPVAGLFRDFGPGGQSFSAASADQRWSTDIHPPGAGGLGRRGSDASHDRDADGPSLPYLAQLITSDARFPAAMVKYAWKQVIGDEPIGDASDLQGLDFDARTTLILSQERYIQGLIDGFVRQNYNLMWVYRQLFTSTWYRTKSLNQTNQLSDEVYEGVGRFGTLTPEGYFRRIEAVFGEKWPLNVLASEQRVSGSEQTLKRQFFTRTDSVTLNFDLKFGMIDESFAAFFGGIDFQNNLTRARQMNSVMTLVSRRVANEFPCLAVYADLKRDVEDRLIFKSVITPLDSDEPMPATEIQTVLVDLFQHFLGYELAIDDDEIRHAYDLWIAVRESVVNDPDRTARLVTPYCVVHGAEARGEPDQIFYEDEHGRVQAWMAVVTYLMTQPEFIQR